jgi:hypothetical protein
VREVKGRGRERSRERERVREKRQREPTISWERIFLVDFPEATWIGYLGLTSVLWITTPTQHQQVDEEEVRLTKLWLTSPPQLINSKRILSKEPEAA